MALCAKSINIIFDCIQHKEVLTQVLEESLHNDGQFVLQDKVEDNPNDSHQEERVGYDMADHLQDQVNVF